MTLGELELGYSGHVFCLKPVAALEFVNPVYVLH